MSAYEQLQSITFGLSGHLARGVCWTPQSHNPPDRLTQARIDAAIAAGWSDIVYTRCSEIGFWFDWAGRPPHPNNDMFRALADRREVPATGNPNPPRLLPFLSEAEEATARLEAAA